MSDDTNLDPIGQLNLKVLKDRIAQQKEQFAKMNLNAIRTIPENIFITHFLPFFAGEGSKNIDEVLETWHRISGNNFTPVNIVDNKGNVVIQVPPIHNGEYFKPIVNRKIDMAYHMRVAREKSMASPKLGERIVSEQLGEKLSEMIEDSDHSEVTEKWMALFKHYKKNVKAMDVSNGEKPVEDDGDDFEY